MLMRGETSNLDSLSSQLSDLSNGSTVIQNGYSLSLAHRLTPDAGLNIFVTRQFSRGSLAQQESSIGSFTISWLSRVGQRSSVALGLRKVAFDNATSPYTESAITANLIMQF